VPPAPPATNDSAALSQAQLVADTSLSQAIRAATLAAVGQAQATTAPAAQPQAATAPAAQTPTATATATAQTPAATVTATAQVPGAIQACPTLLTARARVVAQFNQFIALFPQLAARLTEIRNATVARLDDLIARFGCAVPSG